MASRGAVLESSWVQSESSHSPHSTKSKCFRQVRAHTLHALRVRLQSHRPYTHLTLPLAEFRESSNWRCGLLDIVILGLSTLCVCCWHAVLPKQWCGFPMINSLTHCGTCSVWSGISSHNLYIRMALTQCGTRYFLFSIVVGRCISQLFVMPRGYRQFNHHCKPKSVSLTKCNSPYTIHP